MSACNLSYRLKRSGPKLQNIGSSIVCYGEDQKNLKMLTMGGHTNRGVAVGVFVAFRRV